MSPVKEDPAVATPPPDVPAVTEHQKWEGEEAMRIAKINHPEVDWQADPITGAPLVGPVGGQMQSPEPQPLLDEDDPDSPHVIPTQQAEKERKEQALQDATAEPTGKDKERVEADAKAAKAAEKAAKEDKA